MEFDPEDIECCSLVILSASSFHQTLQDRSRVAAGRRRWGVGRTCRLIVRRRIRAYGLFVVGIDDKDLGLPVGGRGVTSTGA